MIKALIIDQAADSPSEVVMWDLPTADRGIKEPLIRIQVDSGRVIRLGLRADGIVVWKWEEKEE